MFWDMEFTLEGLDCVMMLNLKSTIDIDNAKETLQF